MVEHSARQTKGGGWRRGCDDRARGKLSAR